MPAPNLALCPLLCLFVPQVEQVVQLLKLADWFDAHELRDRCDKRLCQLLTGAAGSRAAAQRSF